MKRILISNTDKVKMWDSVNDHFSEFSVFLKPDMWKFGGRIETSDYFSDYRIETGQPKGLTQTLAINLYKSGRKIERDRDFVSFRVKIVFPGDGEPDSVTYGTLYIPEVTWNAGHVEFVDEN